MSILQSPFTWNIQSKSLETNPQILLAEAGEKKLLIQSKHWMI